MARNPRVSQGSEPIFSRPFLHVDDSRDRESSAGSARERGVHPPWTDGFASESGLGDAAERTSYAILALLDLP